MSNIFDKTIDVLRERGWTRGRPTQHTGEVCAGQAMLIAAGHEGTWHVSSLLASNAPADLVIPLRWLEARLTMSLPAYNDMAAAEDTVIALLISASEAWELASVERDNASLQRVVDDLSATLRAVSTTTFAESSPVPNYVPAGWLDEIKQLASIS